MRLRRAVAAVAAVWALSVASTLFAQEPYWESQPLSYWVSALSGQDAGSRAHAASSLAEMAMAHGGIALATAVPELLPNLGDGSADVRESAARALEQIGAPAARPAVPALVRLLNGDENAEVRRRAALALGRIDPASHEVIAEAARSLRADRDTTVRVSAAVLLLASRDAAARASDALTQALSDESSAVRLYSAAALAHTPGGESAVPRLIAAAEDADPVVRAEAIGLIVELQRDRPDLVDLLVNGLQDVDPEVRGAAADALGSLGRRARPALPALGALLRDPDESVRERVLRAVRTIRRS
jgi:HEAT repeat protein